MQRERTRPSDAEIAWAAGLFEGEGCFTYCTGPQATLNMTDFEPVRRFAEIVGVGTVRFKPRAKPHWNDQLVWRVANEAGFRHVFETLRPWLCARRVATAERILQRHLDAVEERARRREEFCRNGHPRTPENTRMLTQARSGKPYARCKICERESNLRGRERDNARRRERRRAERESRDLARDGLLVDLDGAFAAPDLAEAA